MSIRINGKLIASVGGGGGGAGTNVLVDDLTIEKHSSDIITTIGMKAKSGDIIHDWIGTLAEYNEGVENGTIPDNWICWVIDDNNITEDGIIIEPDLSGLANIDLSNLSEDGKAKFDEKANVVDVLSKSQITNCILEIPQRIKLELKDGVLTLKAGSEVIVPNGFEEDGITPKFDYVKIESDLTTAISWTANGKTFLFYDIDGNALYNQPPNWNNSNLWSGDNPTIDKQYGIWYNTSNNIIQGTVDTGATWMGKYSLPLAIYSCGASKEILSINQIFNGMGYIGSCYWADKGVKVLISDGRNEDGSLKSIVYEYPKIKILNNSSWDTLGVLYNGYFMHLIVDGQGIDEVIFQPTYRFYSSIDSPADSAYSYAYLKDENRWYFYDGSKWIKCQVVIYANMQTKGGYFIPKTSFRLVDSSELLTGETFKTVVESYTNGNSWYRIWSDGWIEQGGVSSGAIKVTFIKAFLNANYTINVTRLAHSENIPAVTDKTATDFFVGWKVYNQNYNANTTNCSWYACGY